MKIQTGLSPRAIKDTTRNRILDAALSLFNDEGIAKITINRIAAELGMSSGNLYYHFKTKEQIADGLVRRLPKRIEAVTITAGQVIALDDLWLILHLLLEAIQEYRFVYRDVDFLVRESPRIAERIQRVTADVVTAVQQMCAGLAAAAVIRATSEEVNDLAVQMVFTATCWHTFARVWPTAGGNGDADVAGRAAYHVLTLLTPYLAQDARLYMRYLRSKYVK
jgi:AcrR family transcriptional regulator